MPNNPLNLVDLAFALGMIALAIGLSAWQKIGLEFAIALATGRTILQLLILSYVLDVIFALNTPSAVLAILAVMLTVTAIVARNRLPQKSYLILPLIWGAACLSTILTLTYTTLLIIQPTKWYEAQYLIPLAATIIGNATNSAAIAGEHLLSKIKTSHQEIETHLSLGATPAQSVKQYQQEAIRAALLPNINQMTIIGIVTLPGIFTGQLLSGIKPLEAASYQILILLILILANLTTTLLVTQGLATQSFTPQAQLKTL